MMKRMLVTAVFAALVAAPAVADEAQVAKGKALTAKYNCKMCHAVGGQGGKLAKPLDGVIDRRDDAALRRILTDPQKELPPGKVKMPKVAWATGDVDAVIAYLHTLKAPK